jgi:hypothetical protein
MLKRIILLALLLVLITKTEETKMGLNPANWAITDYLQGQNGAGGAGGGAGGGGGGTWTQSSFSAPTSSPSSGFPPDLFITDNTQYGQVGSNAVLGENWQGKQTTAPAAPIDPYAKYGGKAAFDSLLSGFNTQKGNIFNSANEEITNIGNQYNRSILDFLDSARTGQQSINDKASANELAKMQGGNDILDMVGRGIRSGGVTLNNRNAGDSSGAEAIARAYGDIGRREMGKVGNQYELGNNEVNTLQDTFNTQQAAGVRKLQGTKDDSINSIVSAVGQSLASLDAKMAEASIPERIAIEQEKARIKSEAIAKLQAYDAQLTSGVSGITPMSQDARLQKANEMRQAGTSLGEGMFDYTTQAPAVMQGGAPAGANFPLFTLSRNRKEA